MNSSRIDSPRLNKPFIINPSIKSKNHDRVLKDDRLISLVRPGLSMKDIIHQEPTAN